ncbi:MAG: diguanylate cyclase [Thermodesulfobacteriota bacterium]|nr:diguanylate cyclase [Thermodesulfobacteriota bacterium]
MKVLLIDDNRFNAKMVRKLLLSDPSFTLNVANSLETGLGLVEDAPVDAVLLALNLPDSWNGDTFLKFQEKAPNLPVVILTGQDDEEKAMAALRNGAQDYLVKGDFNRRILHRALKYAVERKKSEELLIEKNMEIEAINKQLETIIEKSNQMTISAETTSVELNQIFNTAADAMWVIDKNHKVLRVNDAFVKFLGQPRDSVVGGTCSDFFQCTLCNTPDCPMTVIKTGQKRFEKDTEARNVKSGKTPFILTATPFRILDGELMGIIVNLKDITVRKEAEETLHQLNSELELLSMIDGLTQIPNRRQFDKILHQEWPRLARDGAPLSVIICDIDCFKQFNDSLGHQAGDECLKAVADSISNSARRTADLPARYGGEEFSIILPNTPAYGAICVAERMRLNVNNLQITHPHSEAGPHVSISLGVSTIIPSIALSPETVLKAADAALYEAKEMGRNQVRFRHS